MASYDLIDSYLSQLAARLAWHRDVDDLIAEIRDHLYSAAEDPQYRDVDSSSAQREVVGRLGSVEHVALDLVSTADGRLAMPTRFTRRSGWFAVASAALWVGVAVAWWLSLLFERQERTFDVSPRIAYVIGNLGLLTAASLTATVIVGLQRRHGGLGFVGRAGLVFALLSVVLSVFGWFVLGWSLAMAAAAALVGFGALRRDIAPTTPLILFAGGWACGLVVWLGLWLLAPGAQDDLLGNAAVTIGGVSAAVGLGGLGRWFLHESNGIRLS